MPLASELARRRVIGPAKASNAATAVSGLSAVTAWVHKMVQARGALIAGSLRLSR